jgi:hypothetical protein
MFEGALRLLSPLYYKWSELSGMLTVSRCGDAIVGVSRVAESAYQVVLGQSFTHETQHSVSLLYLPVMLSLPKPLYRFVATGLGELISKR